MEVLILMVSNIYFKGKEEFVNKILILFLKDHITDNVIYKDFYNMHLNA